MDSTEQQISVSIVIPVYNGEDSIGRLVDELLAELSYRYDLEVVLINDNSSDRSEEVCIALHERYKTVVSFFSLSKNVGEHNAVMAGLNNVSKEFVVIMDDDFQNPVSEVIKLISYASNNSYDVVYTCYEEKKHSLFRNLGSKFNDKVANVMLKKPKDLYLSSFKIFNKFILDELIKYDLPFPYIDGLILRLTDNIGKLTVKHHETKAGKSRYNLKKLVSLWLNMFTNFSIFPLRVSIYIGFAVSFTSLLYAGIVIIEKFVNPDLPIGFAALMVSIAFLAGIQLLSLGMIGEYVGRIFLSQNKKAQFTIRSRYVAKKKARSD